MTDVDLNDIKAGKYELVALQWDEILSKPGEPFNFKRHKQGDVVELNVEDARRLVRAGAVVKPGSRQKAQAQLALANFRAALEQLTPEQRKEVLADAKADESGTSRRSPRKSTTPGAEQSKPPGETGGTDGGGPADAFPVDGDADAQLAWLTAATIPQVTAAVEAEGDLRETLLALEQSRGEDARTTLVAALSAE